MEPIGRDIVYGSCWPLNVVYEIIVCFPNYIFDVDIIMVISKLIFLCFVCHQPCAYEFNLNVQIMYISEVCLVPQVESGEWFLDSSFMTLYEDSTFFSSAKLYLNCEDGYTHSGIFASQLRTNFCYTVLWNWTYASIAIYSSHLILLCSNCSRAHARKNYIDNIIIFKIMHHNVPQRHYTSSRSLILFQGMVSLNVSQVERF